VEPFLVVALDEVIQGSLLPQDIGRRWLGGLALERQMHPLMAAVLFRVTKLMRSIWMPSRNRHTASLLRP
jgi:hypothetical protein